MPPRALSLFLVCSLLADASAAREPSAAPSAAPSSSSSSSSVVEQARAAVQAQVVEVLQQRERKRSAFSRAPAPPLERRVRILDAAPIKDAADRGFVRFAVDERRGIGRNWDAGWTTGCVYVDDHAAFVGIGDVGDGERFRRAAEFLGGGGGANVPVVCRPAASTKA